MEIVKFLYFNRGARFPYDALVTAARKGYLEIVKFLCSEKKNIHNEIIDDAMDWSGINEHHDVFDFLEKIRKS